MTTDRECARCLNPLPDGATVRRMYCSDTCRVYASRDRSVTQDGLWDQPVSVASTEVLSASTPTPEPVATAPRRPLAAIAADIATPADSFGLARAYAEVRGGGFGVVFGRDAGRVHEPVGPVFKAPRQAIDLAELLNGRLAA